MVFVVRQDKQANRKPPHRTTIPIPHVSDEIPLIKTPTTCQHHVYPLAPEEVHRRHHTYQNTCCDKHAANHLDMERVIYLQWRWRAQFPAKKCTQPKPTPSNTIREFMWRSGADDAEIAYVAGVHHSAIWNWRKKNGYPANKARESNLDLDDTATAIFSTKSDREAAKELGRLTVTVQAWRKRHEIPIAAFRTRIGAGPRSERYMRRWDAYCVSGSVEQAAAMLGISPLSMRKWVTRNELPRMASVREVRRLVVAEAKRGCNIARRAAEVRSWLKPENSSDA